MSRRSKDAGGKSSFCFQEMEGIVGAADGVNYHSDKILPMWSE